MDARVRQLDRAPHVRPDEPDRQYATVPRAFVFIQRINLGLYALLGELGATGNYRRIAEELWPFVNGTRLDRDRSRPRPTWLADQSPANLSRDSVAPHASRIPSSLSPLLVALSLAACGSDDRKRRRRSTRHGTPTRRVAGDDAPPRSPTSAWPPSRSRGFPPTSPTVSSRPPRSRPNSSSTDIEPGAGHEAVAGDTVIVDYIGVRSEDGVEFDNSYDRGQPFDVLLGSRRRDRRMGRRTGRRSGGNRVVRLDIPAELAYGDNPPAGDRSGSGRATPSRSSSTFAP